MTPDELAAGLRDDPALRDVRLRILHGSRAREEAGPRADWDLGYLADPGADLGGLAVAITSTLRTDRVDLATASALLRYRIARGRNRHFRVATLKPHCSHCQDGSPHQHRQPGATATLIVETEL